ncbi:thioredoxin domain-containing protein [Corynebacterium sp. H128]|uniref:DsbA family protein n=1 Tax=Corynebacterium sp. H128 TaxID=3133427 RepID=UPI0030A6147A
MTETEASAVVVDKPAAARSRTPLLVVIVALIAAIAGLLGYMMGGNAATKQFIAENPSSATAIKAKLKDVKAGTGDKTAKPLADGTYNAQIQGSGGPLQSQEDITNVHRRNAEDPFAIGAVDAPVVISEFSDFECPFCARYATETDPKIMSEYVDKGLVRIEWNDLPINGPAAEAAAKAGRAAAEQGKFNEFKNALFAEAAKKDGHPNFGEADFERFATEAGVPDMAKFKADAASDKYDGAISQAVQYGSGLGVNGTPAFLVGTKFVSGAQPWEVFKATIDEQLAMTV